MAFVTQGGHARAKWQNIAESPIALEVRYGGRLESQTDHGFPLTLAAHVNLLASRHSSHTHFA